MTSPYCIIRLRKTEPPRYPDPRTLLASNPYTPPAILAQSIMKSSPLLSALVVVREWLHDSAATSPPLDPGATNGYWTFTRHVVVQNLRMGSSTGGTVSEMDPDAVNRGTGKALAVDDAVGCGILNSVWPLTQLVIRRTMKSYSYRHCSPWFAQGGWRKRWRCVDEQNRTGAQQASAVLCYCDGKAYVSLNYLKSHCCLIPFPPPSECGP